MPFISTNKNETCAHDRENIILNSVVYAKNGYLQKNKKEKGAGGWEKIATLGDRESNGMNRTEPKFRSIRPKVLKAMEKLPEGKAGQSVTRDDQLCDRHL